MKSSKPPALASWMLEHLTLGPTNEALAGDLLEDFQRRRSAAWYWRQVLGAIVLSFLNELGQHWVTLTAQFIFVGIWVWVCAYCDFAVHRYFVTWAMGRQHYAWAVWLVWCAVFFVALPLGIYLAAVRRLDLKAFARGLAAGWSVWVIITVLGSELMMLYAIHAHRPWGWSQPAWALQASIPVLVAIWTARSSRKRLRSPEPSSA